MKTNGNVGASCAGCRHKSGIIQRKRVDASNKPQGRGRVGGTAAETCRDWNILLKKKIAGLQAGNALASGGDRLENQIFADGPTLPTKGTGDFESLWGVSAQRQYVAKIGERNQALDLVVPVWAATENPQRQIDFCRSLFEQRRAHTKTYRLSNGVQPPSPLFLPALACDEVSSGRPSLSFASILGSSSASGLRSRAWAHWNLASSTRPIRQYASPR